MTDQLKRMVEDPSEPMVVRELLQAGANDKVSDLDYRKGLIKHMSLVAGGAILPAWAKGLMSSTGSGASIATGVSSIAAIGISTKLIIAAVVGLPIISTGVVAAVIYTNSETPNPPEQKQISQPTYSSQGLPSEKEQQILSDQQEASSPRHSIRRIKTGRKIKAPPSTGVERPLQRSPKTFRNRKESLARDSYHKNRSSKARVSKALPPTTAPDPKPQRMEYQNETSSVQTTGKSDDLHARWARGEEVDLNGKQTDISPDAEKENGNRWERQQEEAALKKQSAELSPFQREMRMLAAANRLLDEDPEEALRLARIGEREYPQSMFTEERRHVLILALIKLERIDEARRIARPYLQKYPNSPFSQRIRHALAKALQ